MPPPLTPQAEIELKLRNSVSAVLKQVGQDIEEIKRKAKELGSGGSKSLGQWLKESDDTNKSAAAWSSSVTSMHGAFTTIGRNLAGPFGIAAGLYAVGKALEDFNLKTLELSHISANVHISIEDLTKLRQAAWRTTGDIKSGLAQVQRVVEVVDTLRFSRSQFYDDLRIMGRKSLADSLRNAVLAGQGMDAVRQLYDDFAKEDDSHQHALTVAVGVDRVILAQGSENLKKYVGERRRSVQKAYEAHQRWLSSSNRLTNAANTLANKILDTFRKPHEEFKKLKTRLASPLSVRPSVPPSRAPSGRHVPPSAPPTFRGNQGDRGYGPGYIPNRDLMPGGGYPVRPITSGGGLAPAFSFSGNQGDRGYGPGLVAPFSPYGNYEGVMRTRPRLSFPPSPTPNVALGVGQGQAAWWGNQGDKGYGSGLTSPLSTSGMYEGIMRTRPRLSFPPSDLMPGRGYPAGAVTSGMLPPIMEYAVSPHLGGGQGGFAGPNFLAGGRMAIGGGPASFSNAPYGLNYPAVPPSGWAVSGHRGGGEGGPAGPRWFGRSSDIGHTEGSWGGRFGTLPPIPGPDYAISGHRGSGEGGPAGPYSFGGRTDIGPISQLFERLGVLPPIPGPDYVSSGHRGSGEGGLAGPYSRGGRSDVGPTGGAWGRYGALPPIPGPDYVSSGHLGGAQPGPGTTSAWSSGRTMEYGNLPPIPGPEYMWGHSGRSDTRHTMGVGGREGFGISGSLINSRSFMGAPDLMRRFGSGAYTRYHIASNEGFAGPTGPGDAAGGFMMPPGLDFSKLGTMDLPPTGAGQLGSKGGSIDYTGGGVGSLAGGMGPAGLPGAKAYDPRSWFQRLKDRIYGAGAASVGALNYTAADRLQVAEETGKSLIDISAILHRMEQQGGAPGYPPFSGGGYGTPGGGGPTFRPGKTPGRYTSRGGRQYMGGDTPAPSGVGGALYDPITGTALGGGLGAARPGHVHQGDDIEAPEGSPIYAIRDGTIRSHNAHGTYQGDAATRIYFDDGTSAYYMHHHLDPELAARLAKGEHPRIKGGQVLGTSGTAAGVGHLHFQLYDASGRIISPRAYFGWNRSNLPKGGQTAITSPTQLQPVPIDKDKLPLVSPGPVPPEHERGRIRPQVGIATWYQPGMSRDAGGGTTASGEAYNRNEWTAAVLQSRRGDFGGVTSRSGPGYALVESRDGKKAVIKINDVYGLSQEGTGRIIDLNRRSADFFGRGLIPGMKVTALPGYNGPVGPLEEGQASKLRGSLAHSDSEDKAAEHEAARQLMNSRYTEQPKAPKINVKIRLKNVHPGTQTLHEVEGDTIGDVTMSKSKASAEPVFNLPSGI